MGSMGSMGSMGPMGPMGLVPFVIRRVTGQRLNRRRSHSPRYAPSDLAKKPRCPGLFQT